MFDFINKSTIRLLIKYSQNSKCDLSDVICDTENVQFWGGQQNQTAMRCQLFSEIDVKIA